MFARALEEAVIREPPQSEVYLHNNVRQQSRRLHQQHEKVS